MKTIHKITIAACVLFFALLAVSCLPKTETMGDVGQTLVKLHPDTYKMLAVDAKTTPQLCLMFEVRRDAANAADLNSTTTVVLKYDADTSILKAYNKANSTSFIPIPPALGTVSPAITAGQITLNFAAGDFSKSIWVNLPSSGSFDFSKHYALAFKVLSVTGTGTLTADLADQVVVEVLAKNKYDGLYLLKGVHNRVPYNFPYSTNVEMRTFGATSVAFYWPDAGSYGHPIGVGPGNDLSWYGAAISPVVVFDPVTDFVTNVYNAGGSTPITMFTGAGANSNKYVAATKTIYVTWNYNNNPLRVFTDTLTYISPR
ncbi:MAG: DUF1735 domain-containing protein [Bacteroidales bacterium]